MSVNAFLRACEKYTHVYLFVLRIRGEIAVSGYRETKRVIQRFWFEGFATANDM